MDFVNFDKENKQLEQKLTDIETCVDEQQKNKQSVLST